MRLSKNIAGAVVGAVAFVALSAASHASTVTTIFGTGTDASGNVQSGGSDIHYTSPTAPTTLYYNGAYQPDDAVGGPGSAWIGADSAFPNPTEHGTADYTVHFTLANITDAVLSGMWGADNNGLDILINGNSTGIQLAPGDDTSNFNVLHSFTTTLAQSSFFHIGDNTLTFVVSNDGGPGAFRAGNLQVAATPIPASILMLLTALGGMGFLGYRRKGASSAA
jgi:hypothetical protein